MSRRFQGHAGQIVLTYWFLFFVPALAAFQERAALRRTSRFRPLLFVMMLMLAVLIGFRYQVGADWNQYIGHLENAQFITFEEIFDGSDPGYVLLNWIAAQTNNELWTVNLLCGGLFAYGLISFARIQPRPWLAIVVAVPYLIMVVAMGYSRQAVAIGLAMRGLAGLERERSTLKFVIWVALAASFHKTATMLVPLAALSVNRGKLWTAIWVGGATLLLYYLFLEDSVDSFVENYLERGYESQGAAIRVFMNALPAAVFLVLRRRFDLAPATRRLWTNMAFVSLAFIVFLVISPSSTAVDRMALYMIPVQIFVLSRLPEAFPHQGKGINPVALAVLAYSAVVQFVWLNFAVHAQYWLPYQFFPIEF